MSVITDPRWLALTTARRNELLKEYRSANVEYDWWDFLYEDFIQDLAAIGIAVDTRPCRLMSGKIVQGPQIFFSGFWSQGDGACFEGRVEDWPKLLTAMGETKFIPEAKGWRFTCAARGIYCHSGYMQFDCEIDLEPNPYDADDQMLQHVAWKLGRATEDDVGKLVHALEAKFRELADDLYKKLEEEYDHQTSDEQVIDWILEHVDELELRESDEEFFPS